MNSRNVLASGISALFRLGFLALLLPLQGAMPPPHKDRSAPPTSSSAIAISNDDRFVWVVNPDNDSVSLIEVSRDVNSKIAEIRVGEEPRSVSITPNGKKVYVTNSRSGTVSVIDTKKRKVLRTFAVGTEPNGCALSPDGKKLFVANTSSDSVSVIDTQADHVKKTIRGIGPKPFAIACSSDKVYVTLFLAQLCDDARSAVEKEGRDDGKEGRVIVLDSDEEKSVGTVVLHPIADPGFRSNGSVLDGFPPVNPPEFTFVTGAFPNQLHNIIIKGDRAYVPSIGASPNGPLRFNVNVQSLLSVFDLATETETGQTINMNRGVDFEPSDRRLFITNPQALAFKHHSNEGFVVSSATDRLVRLELDPSGTPMLHAPLGADHPGHLIRIAVGLDPLGTQRNCNPQGIVINSTDTRSYVMNFISRDVSVVDISGDPANYHEIARIPSADLPPPGTFAAVVHRGNELFNTSIGPEGTYAEGRHPAGRMSNSGWGSCYGCHPGGRQDGVTWMFADGPRQTISMESTGEHPQPVGSMSNMFGAPVLPAFKQRALNWSAVRDEIQDFELNIRGVSGGQGLVRDGLGVFNLMPTANTGRDADLDALAAYVAVGIQAPISPRRGKAEDKGRKIFARANCQLCHGGPNWTRSQVDFTPPPLSEVMTNGQLLRFLADVGTFDPLAFNEVRPSGTNIVTAQGALGYNIPSLRSIFASAPYFHNGSAPTLEDLLENVPHRSAGTGGVDTLSRSRDRDELIKFLLSIDDDTPPFP
jgi:YVTN family beta-propeller protein